MKNYLMLLNQIMEHGEHKEDRTGTGTLSLFGAQLNFDQRLGFPLITTKQMFTKGIIHELLWFLKGDTNTKYLNDHDVHIWDAWADEHGDLGNIYGKQWRSWETPNGQVVDQIKQVIEAIKTNPQSRRLIVSAWNVGELTEMALPPCHLLFQFHVHNNEYLSLQLYQRSADMFLGVPFNIASYALLLSMVAQVTGLKPKLFCHRFGDAHIYMNHFEQVRTQLKREPIKLVYI